MRWRQGTPLRVETARFRLRSLTPADATETYVKWWNDPEIQDGLNSAPHGWGRQRARRHIAQFDNKQKFHLGIFCKESLEMIGFFAIFITPHTKVAKTNIVIGEKQYWGKRLVLEVRHAMLSLLFDSWGIEKVKGEIMGRNLPSIFNYKALGFTCEGILRNEVPHYKGGRADTYIFGLLREEWEAMKAKAATTEETVYEH